MVREVDARDDIVGERDGGLAHRIKYSNKISMEHSRQGMSVCVWRCTERTN